MKEMKHPKISIITTNFNGAKYLEDAIVSVLDQKYPNLEYIIVDGGSSDGSIEIIKKYEKQLAWWVSEPDSGMYQAIQKGFDHCTGEIMAWLNSDDKYVSGAFSIVEEIFSIFPQVEWLTSSNGITWDQLGRAVNVDYRAGFNRSAFYRGSNLTGRAWHSTYFIQQESTFWRRALWERSGGQLEVSLKLAGDFELWAKFYRHAELYTVGTSLGGMRAHENQKTANKMQEYLDEAEGVLHRYGGHPYSRIESAIRRIFHYSVGRSFIPRHRLPKLITGILDKTPLFYPVRRCMWFCDGWKIIDGYIV